MSRVHLCTLQSQAIGLNPNGCSWLFICSLRVNLSKAEKREVGDQISSHGLFFGKDAVDSQALQLAIEVGHPKEPGKGWENQQISLPPLKEHTTMQWRYAQTPNQH